MLYYIKQNHRLKRNWFMLLTDYNRLQLNYVDYRPWSWRRCTLTLNFTTKFKF